MLSNYYFRLLLIFFFIFSLAAVPVFSQDQTTETGPLPSIQNPAGPSNDMSMPAIVQLDDDTLKIGGVILNKKDRYIRINGRINMHNGLIEYLACSPNGKLHESALVLDAQPYHIQVALLLLGLVPGDQPIEFQGSAETPCGDPVKMLISWQANGQTFEVGPEQLVTNINTLKPMAGTDWVFTGSMMHNAVYEAQIEGSVIAIFHDPVAIIDHRSKDGTDDRSFFSNAELLPPIGTPVVLKIFPITDPDVTLRTRCMHPDTKIKRDLL